MGTEDGLAKEVFPRVAGHSRGVESVKDIVKACAEIGVKYLTLYTFSTENWKRPKDEVSTLMRLLVKSLRNEADELNENNIRLTTIGDIKALPEEVQKELYYAMEKTKNNKRMVLNIALSYSGRWELLEAMKGIAVKIKNKKLSPEDLNEKTIAEHLTTHNMPDPDLLIRTSGEFRVSNFLLWQIAYTEFYISDVYWPAFRRKKLYEADKKFPDKRKKIRQSK